MFIVEIVYKMSIGRELTYEKLWNFFLNKFYFDKLMYIIYKIRLNCMKYEY